MYESRSRATITSQSQGNNFTSGKNSIGTPHGRRPHTDSRILAHASESSDETTAFLPPSRVVWT